MLHMGVLPKIVLWSGISAVAGCVTMPFFGVGPCGPTSPIGYVSLLAVILGLGVFVVSLPIWGISALIRRSRHEETPEPSDSAGR